MKPWSMYGRIKAALDSEDIEGLLAIGAPGDEYNGEASLIEDKIAKAPGFGRIAIQLDLVENFVAEVWNDQFGPFDQGDPQRRRPRFSSVARKITGG